METELSAPLAAAKARRGLERPNPPRAVSHPGGVSHARPRRFADHAPDA
jgi:hypothetical protein